MYWIQANVLSAKKAPMPFVGLQQSAYSFIPLGLTGDMNMSIVTVPFFSWLSCAD